MRAVFGVVSLLIALAIVGLVATRQLKATGAFSTPVQVPIAAPTIVGESVPVPALSASGSVRAQSEQFQTQVVGDIANAAQQAARRTDDADK